MRVAVTGKKAEHIGDRLLCEVVRFLVADHARFTPALDDTPTQRHGPFVQRAGIHYNPTPSPAGSPHVCSHIGMLPGLLTAHPAPGSHCHSSARMYVRVKNLTGIYRQHRPEFLTKLRMGVALLRWADARLKYLGKPVWVVVDGAYAEAPFLEPAMALGWG